MTKPRRKPGPPRGHKEFVKFVPTREQRTIVELACGFGYTQPQICRLIINPQTGKGVDEKTLRENFREELDAGADKATFAVLNNLYNMATKPGPQGASTAMFWAKTRAGFRENVDHNHLHQGTVKHDHDHHGQVDLTKLSDKELDQGYEDALRASAPTQRQSGGKTH